MAVHHHMTGETDIADITDIDKLKAMAYDQITVLEQVQQNLRVINERILQLQQIPDKPIHNGRVTSKTKAG
jgi:hypothetical protein